MFRVSTTSLQIARNGFFLRRQRSSASEGPCKATPPSPPDPVVTVLDAGCTIGRNLTVLLKQNPNIAELRVFDEEHDTCELGIDLSQIDTTTQIYSYKSKELRDAITGANIVISCGGCKERATQSCRQLFDKNLDNVRNVAMYLSTFNPSAIYCVAKPALELLVPLVSEEYKKAGCYDCRKVIGVTSHLSMTCNNIVAKILGKNPAEVLCPIIGGACPQTVIPVVSQAKPQIDSNPKTYEALTAAISHSEDKLLKLGGSPHYSRAVAISRFINQLIKALKGDKNVVDCAFVAQTGHMGDFLPYMTSIVKLGEDGIASSHMPKLNDTEVSYLRSVMFKILHNVLTGQGFVSGDVSGLAKLRKRRECDMVVKQKLEECNARAKKKQ